MYFNTGDLLKKHGHEVVYFSMTSKEDVPDKNSDLFPKRYDIESLSLLQKLKGAKSYFYNKEAARLLEELIKREHPEVAHIHLLWGGLSPSVFRILKKYKIPIVHTAHDYRMVCPAYIFRDGNGNVCERCCKWHYTNCMIRRCAKNKILLSIIMTLEMYYRNLIYNPVKYIDYFIFVSHFSLNKHIEHDSRFSKAKTRVLYNFSNQDVLDYYREEFSEDHNYYLYYGRLSWEKGVETLIKAFSKKKNLNLKIVGTGPIEKELKMQCEKLKALNIEFLGYKKGKDLYRIIERAKFVCVPSEWYENNPMTIIESYTLSVPVIGAKIGGIPELIDEGNTGFLFTPGSVNSLLEAINKSEAISHDFYCTMKVNAKHFANSKFNSEMYYNNLIDIYNSVVESK